MGLFFIKRSRNCCNSLWLSHSNSHQSPNQKPIAEQFQSQQILNAIIIAEYHKLHQASRHHIIVVRRRQRLLLLLAISWAEFGRRVFHKSLHKCHSARPCLKITEPLSAIGRTPSSNALTKRALKYTLTRNASHTFKMYFRDHTTRERILSTRPKEKTTMSPHHQNALFTRADTIVINAPDGAMCLCCCCCCSENRHTAVL